MPFFGISAADCLASAAKAVGILGLSCPPVADPSAGMLGSNFLGSRGCPPVGVPGIPLRPENDKHPAPMAEDTKVKTAALCDPCSHGEPKGRRPPWRYGDDSPEFWRPLDDFRVVFLWLCILQIQVMLVLRKIKNHSHELMVYNYLFITTLKKWQIRGSLTSALQLLK